MTPKATSRALYENLDTNFVNLWSLLRNLTQRGFVGRVHVELKDYSADIFMTGSGAPLVHEVDRAAGTESLEEDTLHRLVLRARETPGTISVFEGAEEAIAARPASRSDQELIDDLPKRETPESAASYGVDYLTDSLSHSQETSDRQGATAARDIRAAEPEPLRQQSVTESTGVAASTFAVVAGELIAAVERAVKATGGDFDSLFRAAQLELADDFSFLDPHAGEFEYSNGVAKVDQQVSPGNFVSGLSEALRRVSNKAATGDRERRIRERIALELLSVARKRKDILERSGFHMQLDRIAGTKVI